MTAVRTGRCARRRASVYARSGRASQRPSRAAASTQSASRRAVCRSASAEVADSGKTAAAPVARGAAAASACCAAPAGACSRMACTLVPENPYDDTAARRGARARGRATAWCPAAQTDSVSIWASSSGSRVKCRFCGTTPCCSARMAFISPSAPGGRLGVPEIGLHRCQRARAVDAVHLGQACVFDRVAHRGAGAVRLDHADRGGVHARRGQRRPIRRDLRVGATGSRCSRCGRPDWRPCRASRPGPGRRRAAHRAAA